MLCEEIENHIPADDVLDFHKLKESVNNLKLPSKWMQCSNHDVVLFLKGKDSHCRSIERKIIISSDMKPQVCK